MTTESKRTIRFSDTPFQTASLPNLHRFSILTVWVRGHFGADGWGKWSPPAGLFCVEK